MTPMALAHNWLKQDIWTRREQLETGVYHARLPEYLRKAHEHIKRRRAYAERKARAEADPRIAALKRAKRDLELKPFAQSIRAEQRQIDDLIQEIIEAA